MGNNTLFLLWLSYDNHRALLIILVYVLYKLLLKLADIAALYYLRVCHRRDAMHKLIFTLKLKYFGSDDAVVH